MAISKIIYKESASATPEVWMDATPATAAAEDITAPKTAMLADGVMTTGTGTGGGGGGVNVYQDANGYIVLDPSGDGGGGDSNPTAPEKLVNFIDYDGTIRYSYTNAEFAELEELPPNPNHAGRMAQGWNWTLSQINAQIASYADAPIWVGQQYGSEDGKTHIRIVIPAGTSSDRMTIEVRFGQTVSNGVEVDWDDGSTPETYSGTSVSNRSHTYVQSGEYDITLDVKNGTIYFEGYYSDAIMGSNRYNRTRLRDVIIGDNVTSIGTCTFYNYLGLKNASLPSTVNISESGWGMYAYEYSLVDVVIPESVANLPEEIFNRCYGLQCVALPGNLTGLYMYSFGSCSSLRRITIPSTVTSISGYAFYGCGSLEKLVIPAGVTSIGGYAFYDCDGMSEFHILAITPPTLGSNAFDGIPNNCVIYVPSASVNAYKSATNWSAYSSYIQGE